MTKKETSVVDPIKKISSLTKNFSVFLAAKLGHFTINYFFLYISNTQTQTKQQKSENEEKKITGSATDLINFSK